MIISHYGVGFAATRFARGVPLFALVGASLLPDIVWLLSLLFGLERGGGAEGVTASPAAIVGGPFSHSLITSVVCAALAGSVYYFIRSDWRGGLVIALCVLSHWLLDALAYNHGLFLHPFGDASSGFGLSQHTLIAACVEVVLFGLGIWLYATGTRKVSDAGEYLLWAFVAVIMLAYVSTLLMPQLNDRQVAWRIVIIIFAMSVFLLQKLRAEKERQPKPKRQRRRTADKPPQQKPYVPPGPQTHTGTPTRTVPPPPPKPAQIRERAGGEETEPQAPAHGRRSWWPRLAVGAAVLIFMAAAFIVRAFYIGSAENVNNNQNVAPQASPESAEAAEERKRVAEAVESKAVECGRVSTEWSGPCRKALDHYKDDPTARRLLSERAEQSNIGGLTTLVVTNWKRNNFANVFSSPAELGLEPVTDADTLQGLARAGKINIDRVLIHWDESQKLFVVEMKVRLVRKNKDDRLTPIEVIIPKGQIIEAKWRNVVTPLPPGVKPGPGKQPTPTQTIVSPVAYRYLIDKENPEKADLLIALCHNQGFARPGIVEPVEANLSMFKLNIDKFQEEGFEDSSVKRDPVTAQNRVHKIVSDYYAQRRGAPPPARARLRAGRGRGVLTASAGAPRAAGASRRL